ncbi:SSU ribosomal protein S1P [uncultured Desulfobacterium sp.]|uniref:SSU ribosomal protein S1P n=1 Tax=uncultured Desulfobacterium sp. TaxID=201089 RepID=A0A445MVS3_9BACT|nr:SSU ribosomal protein S1P [uncultured Desulfobacterium sp.]
MDEENEGQVSDYDPEENFEELLNQSLKAPVRLSAGEKVKAVISNITKEWVFIDLGGKSEGYIPIDEFRDDQGNVAIKEGDTISAFFLSSKHNEMLFTTRLGRDSTGNEHLEDAYHNRIPLEGLVENEIKGGFEVKIAGNVKAFCPYSQMGLKRVENAAEYIGQQLIFKIIEYSEKGRKLVVSHRIVLEEEIQRQKEDLRLSLKEGMTVRGEITSIRKFGAFVDIGGLEGLLPISEISWGRVADVGSSLSVGQGVDVMIKKLDWANDKFSFSLKEVLPDPWEGIELKFPEGSAHTGKVAALMAFGAFVTLEPGVDGLLHISELGKGKRINNPREVLSIGQTVEVKIGKIDKAQRRLSLKMVSEADDSEDGNNYKAQLHEVNKNSSGSLGTLGDILKKQMEKKKRK